MSNTIIEGDPRPETSWHAGDPPAARRGLILALCVVVCLCIVLVFATGCATAGQEAGQGDNSASAAAGNAYAAIDGLAVSGTVDAGTTDGTKIPLLNADGEPVFTPAGDPVYIIPGKGVRDIYVACTIENTADIQQSGTTTSEQAATPSTQTNPSATIPVP